MDSWRKATSLWWHLGFWGLYLLAEFLANMHHYPPGAYGRLWRDALLSLPILAGGAYFIAYVLVPRFLEKGKGWLFLLFTLLTAIAVLWGRVYWLAMINYFESGNLTTFPPSKVLKNVIRDYSVIALAVCLKIIDDWRQRGKVARVLHREKAGVELQLLRAQLQPHFLFNNLNNLYGLALRGSKQTAAGILKLSQILDYLLYHSARPRVPLSREIELLENYFDLERLRYGERLQLRTDFPATPPDLPIAPLLLLPFVENCFKHGGRNRQGVFTAEATLLVEKRCLIFNLSNSKSSTAAGKPSTGGIGLANIRRRLDLLYPGSHTLELDERTGYFHVRLTLDTESESIKPNAPWPTDA